MRHSKKALEILVFVVFFVAAFKLSYCQRNRTGLCIEKEKQSLLSFKKSLKDPSNILSSWETAHDCCGWENVVCDSSTGHVLELKLQSPDRNSRLGGKIDPSLLNLKFLRFLDLSNNDFDGISIPDFFGSLVSLEYLNISSCGFQGTIPYLGNLSSLRSLGLRLVLEVDNLRWLSNLTHLEYLDLTYVNMSNIHDWLDRVNMLPSLIELHLSGCNLDRFSPIDRANFSSLVVLDLSDNKFKSLVPDWIFSLTGLESLQLQKNMFEGPIPNATYGLPNLRFLDLSLNKFNSTIPDWLFGCSKLEFLSLNNNFFLGTISNQIENLPSLRSLQLEVNMLSGRIPMEVGKLCNLLSLYLSYNNFEGNISDVFGASMSGCFLASLRELSVRANRLSGLLPEQLRQFKNLQLLDLGNNSFTGSIPANLGNLSSLETLRLDNNELTGDLPLSFGRLFSLQVLVMENNMLEGTVTESHFSNLTNLTIISASGNPLILKVNQDWIPPFELNTIFLNSWNLGPQIPTWLQTQRNIDGLDLSSTKISGEIPTWFWNLSTIAYLNLSHNELHGPLPDVVSPGWIYLSSNKFSGPLPMITHGVRELDLSNNSFSGGISHVLCNRSTQYPYRLSILHLGGNQISGEIPDCWMNWPSLQVVNLGNNNITGTIPISTGMLGELLSLNLFSNSLSGQIPSALQNCSMLIKMDLSGNHFSGEFPGWIGTSLSRLRILIMHSNSFTGKIPPEICKLNFLHILDLANNSFSGPIPNCLNNMTAMSSEIKLMNLSTTDRSYYSYFLGIFMESATVTTKGQELDYDTILSQFSSIDLSNNRLSGEIPAEITTLAGLRSLNLSRNALSGMIPENIGNMRVLESLDLSRNHISGGIPISISSLTFLSHLNLSYNNLTGRIPLSSQLQSLTDSSFTGNELCGPPLKDACEFNGETPSTTAEEREIDWFYVLLATGFATGFGGFYTIFLYKKTWRNAYFNFLDEKFFNKLGVS
ncbi:Disease resistance family protein [Dorcoceras hygrometricum]|uniref:Disease resistance family protein n=1 Tax=Dorcoceras hygrometricum TaxID=472368 RepID=A0A2Z7BNI3_9LAMI|nr:Disease resistance family protein [Dorcoceras hygrometricum]